LCQPFDFESEIDDGMIAINNRRQWGIYNQNDDRCNPSWSMRSCPVHSIFSKIMHEILNDMYDIKQSAVYGSFIV